MCADQLNRVEAQILCLPPVLKFEEYMIPMGPVNLGRGLRWVQHVGSQVDRTLLIEPLLDILIAMGHRYHSALLHSMHPSKYEPRWVT